MTSRGLIDEAGAAHEAYAVLRRRGLVITKSDLGYTFVCHATRAVERMYELKGRPAARRCVTLATRETIHDITQCDASLADRLFALAERTPFSVVLLVREGSRFVRSLPPATRDYLLQDDTVCLYLGAGRFFDELGEITSRRGMLPVGTSANYSGAGNNFRFDDVPLEMRNAVDLALDLGTAKYANPERLAGTIVNLGGDRPRIQRRAVNVELIERELADLLE